MMHSVGKLKLVTFDGLGTLFEVRGGVGRFYAREARRHGVELKGALPFAPDQMHFKNPYYKPSPPPLDTVQQIQSSFGRSFKEMNAKYPIFGKKNQMEAKDWWKSVVFSTFRGADYLTNKEDEEKLSSISDQLFLQFSGMEGYKLFPETKTVLFDLRERVDKMGIISNSDERIHSVLASLGIDHLFDFIISSREFGEEKPHPAIFKEALRRASVSAEESLHIGDDASRDWEGARGVGMNALLVARDETTVPSTFDSSFCIPDLMPLHSTFKNKSSGVTGDEEGGFI